MPCFLLWVTSLLAAFALWGCDNSNNKNSPLDPSLAESGVLDASVGNLDGSLDVALRCSVDVCDPRMPDSCSEKKCVLTQQEPSCKSDAGDEEESESCSGPEDCEEGLACFATAQGNVCLRICCPGDNSTCAMGETCVGPTNLVGDTETEWGYCSLPTPCALGQEDTGCEDGEGCYVIDSNGNTGCLEEGESSLGEECSDQNDCVPGMICLGFAPNKRCARICNLAGGTPRCGDEEGSCTAQAFSPTESQLGICTP